MGMAWRRAGKLEEVGGVVKRKGWMEDVGGFGRWEGEGRVALVWSQLDVLAEYFPQGM